MPGSIHESQNGTRLEGLPGCPGPGFFGGTSWTSRGSECHFTLSLPAVPSTVKCQLPGSSPLTGISTNRGKEAAQSSFHFSGVGCKAGQSGTVFFAATLPKGLKRSMISVALLDVFARPRASQK